MATPTQARSHPTHELHAPLGPKRIFKTWWPLAASWIFMGLEGPAISAVVARLAEPKINLAAYGGLVFPLALIVEAPIIMMLAASTALCRDRASYVKLRRFMNRAGAALTAVHVVVAATPVYYLLAREVIRAPEEIIEPARLGLLIMIPWTWSIAYRRFHQGVLIRFGHSLRVGIGTVVRLCADGIVLAVGYHVGGLPGVAVASCALVAGVLTEAFYVRVAVASTLRNDLSPAEAQGLPLTTRALLDFYIPLSLTQLLVLLASPIASAAMSRMPLALESLAAWPVVSGLGFMIRGFGGAYNEVVVALVEQPYATRALRRFAAWLAVGATGALAIFMIPPVADAVFAGLLGLAEPLPGLVYRGLIVLLPIPALAVAQSYLQGLILHSRRTRSIGESVGMFLALVSAVLAAGVLWGGVTGIYLALGALLAGEVLRTFWLWLRSRPASRLLAEDHSSPNAR